MPHTRVICEVQDVEPFNLFTAIKERRKVKEVRVIPTVTADSPPSKWETFLPENMSVPTNTFSLLIHNGKGDMKEYYVAQANLYFTFEAMLYVENYNTCIPGSSYDSALALYRSFYKGRVSIKYVVAIILEREIPITKEALEQYKKEVV